MSTMQITASPAFAPRVPATRLRLTARGRRVIAAVAAFPAVVALALAILSSGGALASVEHGAPSGTFTEVTVMPGDTLWSIAESIAPAADPRDVVDEIVRVNALSSGALQAGQTLALPPQYSAGR